MISIDITERVVPYTPEQFTRWHSGKSRRDGTWKEMLPESERRRPKYANQPDYHFGEVLHMQKLAGEGLKWFYENYCLFQHPGKGSRVFSVGYKAILEAYGPEKVAEIERLARVYAPPGKKPKIPDLFAYKGDAPNRIGVRFVEVKRKDSLNDMQLLGLALIQRVFKTPVEVCRYVRVPMEQPHHGEWLPNT